MDVLEKIKKLQEEKGWSTYKLSIESGLTQSTLSNMFLRKTNPNLETLYAICIAFDISLSEFFCEDNNSLNLTLNEIELLKNYRKLDDSKKRAMLDFIGKFSN